MKVRFLAPILCGLAFAQEKPVVFDSADVHVSAPSMNPTFRGGALRGGRFDVRTATMTDLISYAYELDQTYVIGGPSWLDWDRFDVLAKAPVGTTSPDLLKMLQNLLADRFKLVVHKDKKSMPVFALTASKSKPKMKESSSSGDPQCQDVPQAPGILRQQVIACKNMTMAKFVDTLMGYGGGTYFSDPVVDQTGLAGSYDFELKWTQRNRLAQTGADGVSLFDAVDKQLGLKLEATKTPMPVVIVDSVNQKPTPNEAGVETKIPPSPPAEFEVAVIKPTSLDLREQNGRIMNGRLDLQNFTLKRMIQIAWDLDNNDEMLVGAPKSVDSNHWDVTAKVLTAGPVNAADIDFDALKLMLRQLLMDRFGLKVHMEDRPVSAFTMTATKQVKLTKADPQNRTGCKSGAGANPMLNRQITCQNVNMAQLAASLRNMANGYVKAPIKDATGLDGFYDLSVSFSGVNLLPGALFDPNKESGSSDPNGSMTLPEAMQKQLGLKLELEKRPLPVLVVDHVEDRPSEN